MEANKEKRGYYREAEKAVIRDEILRLQEQAKGVQTVPARVVNGSHQDAVEFKDLIASMRSDRRMNTGPGNSLSGRQLLELRDTLANQLAKVLH